MGAMGGIAQGGEQTLLLARLDPATTTPRAPGPGPTFLTDWEPIAEKHLKGRKVFLHTDGVRAYKLKAAS